MANEVKVKVSFWKIFEAMGAVAAWAGESLQPDEDGVVRITQIEANSLVERICKVFGWSAQIEL